MAFERVFFISLKSENLPIL